MHHYYKSFYEDKNYLAHHGVQGQKWGVTNGPPYPLGNEVCGTLSNGEYRSLKSALKADYRSKVDAAYTKAGESYDAALATNKEARKKDIDATTKEYGLLNSAGKYATINDYYNTKNDMAYRQAERQYQSDAKAAKAEYKDAKKELKETPHEKGLSDTTKKILIAAGATAAAVGVGYITYKAIDKVAENKLVANKQLSDMADLYRSQSISNETKAEISSIGRGVNERHADKWYNETKGDTGDEKYQMFKESAREDRISEQHSRTKAENYGKAAKEYSEKYKKAENSATTKAAEKWMVSKFQRSEKQERVLKTASRLTSGWDSKTGDKVGEKLWDKADKIASNRNKQASKVDLPRYWKSEYYK